MFAASPALSLWDRAPILRVSPWPRRAENLIGYWAPFVPSALWLRHRFGRCLVAVFDWPERWQYRAAAD
jgi:hypothetical protein